MRERMGMGRASFARGIGGLSLGLVLLNGILPNAGCQKTDDLLGPSTIESAVLHAVYRSPEEFAHSPIVLDGASIDREWGAGTIPYRNIRLSTENGVGLQAAPEFVSVKAVYTDQDIYFLVRWYDPNADVLENVMTFVGESINDTLTDCQPHIVSERSWIRDTIGGEDRFAIAFETDSAGSSMGSFRDLGCMTACHPGESPVFGRITYGRLDVWQWLAGRTNPVRDLYDLAENPDDPLHGWPGYLDDLLADPFAGLSGDPGTPCFRPNFRPGSDVPLYVYRESDDPYVRPLDPERCRNLRDDRCVKNNGVDQTYIWRDEVVTEVEPFGICDIRLANPLPIGSIPHNLRYGDRVAGWYLTYPSGSRGDVYGKAGYEEHVWILEIGRRLDTGDPANDVIFEPGSGKRYTFTIAVADYTMLEHLGSQPQILVFDPKPEGR